MRFYELNVPTSTFEKRGYSGCVNRLPQLEFCEWHGVSLFLTKDTINDACKWWQQWDQMCHTVWSSSYPYLMLVHVLHCCGCKAPTNKFIIEVTKWSDYACIMRGLYLQCRVVHPFLMRSKRSLDGVGAIECVGWLRVSLIVTWSTMNSHWLRNSCDGRILKLGHIYRGGKL